MLKRLLLLSLPLVLAIVAIQPQLIAQVGGIVLRVQQNGTNLVTRGGGLFIVNCTTNMTCTWADSTSTLTVESTGGGGGTPGGMDTQLQYNNASAFGGVSGTVVTAATGAISLTAQAATTTPLSIVGASMQSKPLLNVNNTRTTTAVGLVDVGGASNGDCDLLGFGFACLLKVATEDDTPVHIMMTNKGDATNGFSVLQQRANGILNVSSFGATKGASLNLDGNLGTTELKVGAFTSVQAWSASALGLVTFPVGVNSKVYQTATNCADSAGAAACGSAAAGAVVVDAGATTVVVSTTSVTANSEIFVQYDSSLGARLSVTCNTTAAIPSVTARTAATSFTVTIPAAPVTDPACYTYHIVN